MKQSVQSALQEIYAESISNVIEQEDSPDLEKVNKMFNKVFRNKFEGWKTHLMTKLK